MLFPFFPSPLVSAAGLNPAQFSLLCFLSPGGGSAYISRPKLKKKKKNKKGVELFSVTETAAGGESGDGGAGSDFFFLKEN